MIKDSNVLSVHRLPEHEEIYPEIKDPSIVRLSNGRYMMFASVGRSSDQQWIVGRFTAPHPMGPWQEISPAEIIGVSGPQMCAPAVIYDDQESGKEKWTMYIQTACFIENGVIAEAHSEDGKTFTSVSASLIAKEHIQAKSQDIVGVYDPGVSQVTVEGEEMEALVFSGYRTIGSGDLYLSFKKKHDTLWSPATLILAQEEVPFHNKPGKEDFEWGLEGGKVLQASENCFLLIAVCFLALPRGFEGQRQRVFFATSATLEGPYIPLGIAFQPQEHETGRGEHGHPDAIVMDNELWIIYQERKGEGFPWHLRYVVLDYNEFVQHAQRTLFMYSFTPTLKAHAKV